MSKNDYCVRVREIVYTDYVISAESVEEAMRFYEQGEPLEAESVESTVTKVTAVETDEVVYEL